MTEKAKGVMAEDKGVHSMSVRENAAIQRELQYKQKIANLFPDGVLPLEVKRWKALISKRNRSTDGIIDCSQTTTTCKYAKVSQETFDSDEEINAKGTISRTNSNVKRQKALISKNKKYAGRIIDCSPTTCIHTEVSHQETLKHLESDGGSTIFKSNSSVNAESPLPDPLNTPSAPVTAAGESLATSLNVMPKHDASTTFQAPNAVVLPDHFPSMTLPPSPSLSPTFTYSRRKKNAKSSNSGWMSPQQQHTSNIIHYCKICGVHCSGALCFELHLRGQKHKVKLESWRGPNVKERNKLVRCDLCEIFCQDETLLKMHLKGQKHKAKQQDLEHGEKMKEQFWCELCQVPCMNKENFTLHCKGKKHQRQLYVLEEKKKAEAKGLRHA